MSATSNPTTGSVREPVRIARIGAGVNGFPEGRDAALLGAAIARAAGAELMLIAVHEEPLVVLPAGLDWTSLEQEARRTLTQLRRTLTPDARTAVVTDISVARGLQRVVNQDHRDLLVLGSSRHAPAGGVRIGKRTRQLLHQLEWPLAVAPRGLHERGELTIGRIGVGYDGGAESEAALALAAGIATGAGAELHVWGVIDDRMPATGWSAGMEGDVVEMWVHLLEEESAALHRRAEDALRALGVSGEVSIMRGRPAARLRERGSEVDLLVVGSRRWGPVARLMLGSTGEALLHDAQCPVLVVPRPAC